MTIMQKIERLERLFDEVQLPPEAIVGADYVARIFNCSSEAVMRGRFGTDKIPRVRNKPLGFKKSEVHRVLREMKKTPAEKAAEIRSKTMVRRRSIIKKK